MRTPATKPMAASRARVLWGGVAVALPHLLILGYLHQARRTVDAKPTVVQARINWLVPMPLLPPSKAKPKPQAQTSAAADRSRTITYRPVAQALPSPEETAAAVDTPPPAQAPVITERSRLNLALPSRPASAPQAGNDSSSPQTAAQTAAQMAAQDPRSNSRRPDMGERMAAALGSDPSLREEIINPGHRRIREGSRCVDVNDTRNSQINPFDENARMGPKLASRCKQ